MTKHKTTKILAMNFILVSVLSFHYSFLLLFSFSYENILVTVTNITLIAATIAVLFGASTAKLNQLL